MEEKKCQCTTIEFCKQLQEKQRHICFRDRKKKKLTNDTEGSAGLKHSHYCNDQIDSTVGVNHDNVLGLDTALDKGMGGQVGGLVQLAKGIDVLLLSEHTAGSVLAQDIPALKDTLAVGEGLGVAGKDIMDSAGPIGPVQVSGGVGQDLAAGRGDDGDIADEDVGLGTSDVEDLDELVEDMLDALH